MFYLIDKPTGISSFFALGKIKRVLSCGKIGHTGTLDPLASGLLLVATDGSTKLISLLEAAVKTYEFEVDFSITSPSLDLGTETTPIDPALLESARATLRSDAIEQIINTQFSGRISQIPPSYSAIRIDGKRAYELTRKGREVEMKSREVEIEHIELLDFQFPKARFRSRVSAGTYIRSLGRDIWAMLGLGGVITELRRTMIDTLSVDDAIHRNSFGVDSPHIAYEALFPEFSLITIGESYRSDLLNGMSIPLSAYTIDKSGQANAPCFIRIHWEAWNFLGEIRGDSVAITRGKIA